jgi:hypothetical protein
MALVPVPIQVSAVEQHAAPHTWAVGQHTPLLQVSAVEQQAAPQIWAVGQHTPLLQVSPEAQHAELHTWPVGQQMAFAPVPMQISVVGAQQAAVVPVPHT